MRSVRIRWGGTDGVDPAPARSLPSAGVPAVRPRWQRVLWILGAAVAAAALAAGTVIVLAAYTYRPLQVPEASAGEPDKETRKLLAAIRKSTPKEPYVVIDRTNNRIWLREGDRVELEGICSAGSGHVLTDPSGKRTWTFDTPQGRFRVRQKTADPVWKKPDWAFIEEGKPVPKNPSERIEYGTLGEYALYLGDGYMIHGTLYERLLGRSVSHGCVRVGRDDLRVIYKATRVGTPVFIF